MRFGPGLLITAAFIGPGTITTASLAGANFGFSLLWVLLFAVIATIILQGMAAKLGLATGQGLAESLRSQLPVGIPRYLSAFLVVSAIGIGSAAYEAGNLTGAALGLNAIFSGSVQLWALLLAGIAALLLYSGKHNVLEKVLMGLVIMMSIVFITTMFLSRPDPAALLSGLVIPQIPDGSLTTLLALIGTTIVPYNLFLHASLMAKRNSTDWQKDLPGMNADNGLSIGLGGLITLAIVATASATFYGNALAGTPNNAASMANQLEPLLGSAAQVFFATGLFAAGLTSAITAPLAGAYAVCGMLGWSTDLRSRPFRLVLLAILLCGVIGASLSMSPLAIILFAQATNGLLLPVVALYLLWLMNRKALLANHVNSHLANLAGAAVVLFLCGLSGYKLWSLL
ncbi:Nramp family divalent metal transporter [Bowmanella sp. Y26]|uniref:Nramp family divalent metal transporter n=1 Tax=Bowmanella yangjiangensis TaxID=2811230 RepID=UPI001BDD0410|nr:Nramp family divalent metal transporter [Bowmanella yangjiangensis]MBT1066181.1 Nramp family divalent metal transporter [Bowmanella yangjiangensis]